MKQLSDIDVVKGLQAHDRNAEKWFYDTCLRYFDAHAGSMFASLHNADDIFQTAFIKLWTEIENGRITLGPDATTIVRRRQDGLYAPMTARLTTFMMAFARNEFREQLRSVKEDNYEELFERNTSVEPVDMADDAEAHRAQIIDDCILQMSANCVEILTMFYYNGMSLDEIMAVRNEKNSSKDGLKTAKNKCMNTLRAKVSGRMQHYNIAI